MRNHTDDEFQELIENLDMEDFLSVEGVDYKVTPGSSGVQLNIKECPRCGGNSWKVYLNMDTGLGNCFHGACVGEPGFNKFSFIRHLLDLSSKATAQHIKHYAVQAGWRPKRKITVATQNDQGINLPAHVTLPHEANGNLMMPRYLINRDITPELAGYFGLLYCRDGYFEYPDPVTGEAKKQDYSRRVLIPVYDLEGSLKTFQGRDTTGESDRKYLFPPGLSGTGRYLYNAHNCIGRKTLVIGEGAFDVIAIKNAMDKDMNCRDVGQVGTFGKSLSDLSDGDSQMSALLTMKAAGLEHVVFMWDGEQKALMDAVDAGTKVAGSGLKVSIAVLPKDRDPAECTPDEVLEAFYKATPLSRATAARLKLKFMRR